MSTSKYTHERYYQKSSDDEKGDVTTELILIITVCVLGTLILVIVVVFCYKKCNERGNNRNGCYNHACAYSQSRRPFSNGMITTSDVQYGLHCQPVYHHGNYFPHYQFTSNTRLNSCYDNQDDSGIPHYSSGHTDIERQNELYPMSVPVANPVYTESLVDTDIGSIHHTFADNPLKDLFKVSDRSFTQTVCGKLLVSIARRVGYKGDVLYLDNMGISLHIPEGAVKHGETKVIALVLNWDLSDNPEMKKEESLVSPVVYVGPHGLKLEKRCTLVFRHCAFNRNQIRVMRSETELTHKKTWTAACEEGDTTGTCNLTPDECQLNIDTFTLYTCIQTPLDNTIGKKWLQIAVFACPLRSEINHHQVLILKIS